MEMSENGMQLLENGNANWDLYLNAKGNYVLSIAKEGRGAADSCFGNLDYFKKYCSYNERKGDDIKTRLTSLGMKLWKQPA